MLRTDNAINYFNQTLSPYFEKEGIVHEFSCVDIPQQNGVVEKEKRSCFSNCSRPPISKGFSKSLLGGSCSHSCSSNKSYQLES